MSTFTLANAKNIVNTLASTQANNNSNINVTNIINALSSVNSTTFAGLTQASKVGTSAKHKEQNIYKINTLSVTLCNSSSSIYNNAVNKEIKQQQHNDNQEAFSAVPSNYVQIDGSYSVCALKSNTNKHYLRAIVNKCIDTVYYCANTERFLSKAEVAVFLTASASKALLEAKTATYVQHANVEHNVTIRTFGLQNIYNLNVNKKQLVA